jgi:collagen type III alpha
MRATGYGADLELTQDSLVIHAGKIAAAIQGASTITIPLADVIRVEWKDARLLVNGSVRVFVSDGVDLRSYGPQPNAINLQSLVVHWRRKDQAAFAALRAQVDEVLAARPEPTDRVPSGERRSRTDPMGSLALKSRGVDGDANPEKALRDMVAKARRGEFELTVFELWGGSGSSVEVVGEAHYRRELAALYKSARRRPGQDFNTEAVLVAEVGNVHDENAVRVDVEGHTVGYLAREDAVRFRPALARLVLERRAPVVKARVWATNDDGTWRGRVTLNLGDPDAILPANARPAEPAAELPEGRTIKVTGVQECLDVLGPMVVAGRKAALWCTLHALTIKMPRSEKRVAEVRIDGQPIGTLTPATSKDLLTVVDRADTLGRTVLAHGFLSGNSLTVSMTLSVPRTSDLTEEWISEHLEPTA